MADDERFLSRWSRLKRAAGEPAVATGVLPVSAPVELPPVESLGFDSDFTGFLQAKVDEKLKQAALKKLFHSPHFNEMDGLDVYIDDYNSFEPIPEEMLRELNHAQDLLFRQDESRQADFLVPADEPIADVQTCGGADELPPIDSDGSAVIADLPAPGEDSGLDSENRS